MINIHFNGDIVRCPDVAAIHVRANAIRYAHKICRFNCMEYNCKQWQLHCMINKTTPEHCNLAEEYTEQKYKDGVTWKQYKCDLMQKNYINAISPKNYKIDGSVYRKLSSSAHYLIKESKSKVLFLTLTLPQIKKDLNYETVNQCFSKFIENLRTNYGCEGYCAVREFAPFTHRVHFHLLLSIPFVPFRRLNDAWCAAISSISCSSNNAVTSDKHTRIIKSQSRAIKYVCKYFSKAKGQTSRTRIVFISNNILQRAKNMDAPLESVLDSFKFDWMKQTSDYTTCYRITDESEFNRFCEVFLYPFFELSPVKPKKLGYFSDH